MKKIILFDLDNTLLDFSEAESQSLKSLHKDFYATTVSYKAFLVLFKKINRYLWSSLEVSRCKFLTPSKVSLKRFEELNAYLKINTSPEEISFAYDNYHAKYTKWLYGAIETIMFLHSQGYKMGIITNGPSRMQTLKRNIHGLDAWFQCFIIADELGFFKPSPHVFHHALEQITLNEQGGYQTKIEPQEVLVVGDSLNTDGLGAEAAGMKFCLVSQKNNIDHRADFYIASVADLPEAIGLQYAFDGFEAHSLCKMEKVIDS